LPIWHKLNKCTIEMRRVFIIATSETSRHLEYVEITRSKGYVPLVTQDYASFKFLMPKLIELQDMDAIHITGIFLDFNLRYRHESSWTFDTRRSSAIKPSLGVMTLASKHRIPLYMVKPLQNDVVLNDFCESLASNYNNKSKFAVAKSMSWDGMLDWSPEIINEPIGIEESFMFMSLGNVMQEGLEAGNHFAERNSPFGKFEHIQLYMEGKAGALLWYIMHQPKNILITDCDPRGDREYSISLSRFYDLFLFSSGSSQKVVGTGSFEGKKNGGDKRLFFSSPVEASAVAKAFKEAHYSTLA